MKTTKAQAMADRFGGTDHVHTAYEATAVRHITGKVLLTFIDAQGRKQHITMRSHAMAEALAVQLTAAVEASRFGAR